MHRASAFVVAAAALAFGASPVLAHFTEWPSSTESIYLSGMIYDTRVADDTYRMRAVMNWNSTRASNMRHQASHGYRFSFDVHDLNGNLNATTRYETSLPNPISILTTTIPTVGMRSRRSQLTARRFQRRA